MLYLWVPWNPEGGGAQELCLIMLAFKAPPVPAHAESLYLESVNNAEMGEGGGGNPQSCFDSDICLVTEGVEPWHFP